MRQTEDLYWMMMQYVARDDTELKLARRKDATCFFRWIMSENLAE